MRITPRCAKKNVYRKKFKIYTLLLIIIVKRKNNNNDIFVRSLHVVHDWCSYLSHFFSVQLYVQLIISVTSKAHTEANRSDWI